MIRSNNVKKIMNKMSQTLLVLLGLVLLAGCSPTVSPTQTVAEKLQAEVPALAEQKIGELNVDSAKTYYTSELEYWKKAKETADLPQKYVAGVEAEFTITTFLTSELDKLNVKPSYLGNKSESEVEGIFIYEFSNNVPFGMDVAKNANTLTKELIEDKNYGEYFYVKGKYLVTIDTSVDAESVEPIFEILDTILTP